MSKPLFIPLSTEYYRLFESGDKTHELRKYGPRWNEGTCWVGRTVVLSRGYGKADRIAGVVSSFTKVWARDIGGFNRIAMRAIYGHLEFEIAEIGIELKTAQREPPQ